MVVSFPKLGLLIAAGLVLSACGGGGSDAPASPGLLGFVAKDTGINGRYHSASYSAGEVRTTVGRDACKGGRLGAFQEAPGSEGRTTFNATCAAGNRFAEGTAGFTRNKVTGTARVTATVGGKLLQGPIDEIGPIADRS
ncbi:hypothetical protein [uncultured Sulfitobacter sp.]|uniref:hypothetical protein n=1 Tax=uncultured Sulfitobacter sp. TaxID=191468 RepID=UPI0026041621|nr:hypothetical protein [uncultured Sulfitobacter sp.]